MNSLLQNALDVEARKLARATVNITVACAQGRISEHDRDERIAREEQDHANRVAWLSGDKRPKQRLTQALDDPNAGVVG